MTTKKNESARKYRLKTERAKIKLSEIQNDYLVADLAGLDWTAVCKAASQLLDSLPDKLLAAVPIRQAPGPVQGKLQEAVYRCLAEIASGALVDKALKRKRA